MDIINYSNFINNFKQKNRSKIIVNIIFVILLITSTKSCLDSNNNQCDYCLSQNDFTSGTYRLTQSGIYCITEDITFNPMSGNTIRPNIEGAWFPDNDIDFPGCIDLSNGAYALGFFTVISIEISNIKLDLNSHTIKYSKYYYLQQRFGSIIEISNQPFLPQTGPANFGNQFTNIENITICNGELGLTSHHSIHSNNASNIMIQNIQMYNFEVAAIQLNGFNNVILQNIDIGPSLQSVPLTAYYSNARFLLLALRKLIKKINENNLKIPNILFAYLDDDDGLTLSDIYDNLVESMDLIFKYSINNITERDKNNILYTKSLNIFKNYDGLPDGSSIYGIILNSFSVAVNGFGDSTNNGMRNGQNIQMENIDIHDIKLKVNEVIAMYFDKCNNIQSTDINVLKGPFGDVLDIGKMIDINMIYLFDEYNGNNIQLNELKYIGNPLSDAQIALYLYRNYVNDGINYAFGSYIDEQFINWAVNGNEWPQCVEFICNGDIMFHTNKGVMGVRLDGIENAVMKNVNINNLENRSPLVSNTCASYSGPHDGGNPGTKEREGGMSTDMRALSVIDGDVTIYGSNNINGINSWYGDTSGIDLMTDAILIYDEDSNLNMDTVIAASKVTQEEYNNLLNRGKTPYPNNFNLCSLKTDVSSNIISSKHINIENDDCILPTFKSMHIPTSCYHRCDAYSVLLENKQYNNDNICLTYNIKRLFSDGFCKKHIKYIVLGVCKEDINCNENDLTGLIQSVSVDGNIINAWGTNNNNQLMGIRIDIHIVEYEQFTICLKDVFNVNDDFSNRVRFRRGKRKFSCEKSYTVGLPCIDSNKFVSGSYSDIGYNKKYGKYKGAQGRKYKGAKGKDGKHSAMSIVENNDDKKLVVFGSTNPYVIWSIIMLFVVFCIAVIVFGIFLCNRKKWNRDTKTIGNDNISYAKPNTEITNGCDQSNIVIDDDESNDETTQYEEIYCDETISKTTTIDLQY